MTAAQILGQLRRCRAGASLTSDANARQRPQRQHSRPERPGPRPRSHLVRLPRRSARPTVGAAARGRFSRSGRGGEGRGRGGWDATGRAADSRFLPSGFSRSPRASLDPAPERERWETIAPLSPPPSPRPRGPACQPGRQRILVPGVRDWALGVLRKARSLWPLSGPFQSRLLGDPVSLDSWDTFTHYLEFHSFTL